MTFAVKIIMIKLKICHQDYPPKSVKSADCPSTGGKSGRKTGTK